jgi:prepilin-type N-terminal cleavage/methylation domain-containing protein
MKPRRDSRVQRRESSAVSSALDPRPWAFGRRPSTLGPRPPLGFTLIEIMMVIGIAALVMAVSVPFVYRALHKDPLSQALNEIVEACQQARAQAILRGITMELRIRPLEGVFQVVPAGGSRTDNQQGAGELLPGELPNVPSGAAVFTMHVPEKVVIEELAVNFISFKDEEEARVRFHSNGTSDEFTIVIQVDQQQWRKISLDVVTAIADWEVFK